MTTRSWQIYGVGFIVVVVAAVVALWISPADAQDESQSKARVVRSALADRTPREPAPKPAPRPAPRPNPKPVPTAEPAPREPAPPVATPPVRPAPREPVAPPRPQPVVTPRPEPVQPVIAPIVQPAPVEPPPRPIRPRPDRPSYPEPPRPPKVAPAPAPPPVFDPIIDIGPIEVPIDVFVCERALICPLDRWDDVIAWRLVDATGIYYWELAYERLDGWSWYAIMNRLDIDRQVFYAALGVNWAPRGPFRDDDVRMAMVHQTGDHVVPEFSCALPLELPPTRQFPTVADAVDERIARRISEDTLWCEDTLLALYERLHSWAAVGRTIYLSPYAFESIFGVGLSFHADAVEYPVDADLRFAVLEDPGSEDHSSTLGKVAKGLTLVALGVAGVVSGLF